MRLTLRTRHRDKSQNTFSNTNKTDLTSQYNVLEASGFNDSRSTSQDSSSHFMRTEGSLPCSQQPVTGSCPHLM